MCRESEAIRGVLFRAEVNNEREDRMKELVNFAGFGWLRDESE